MNNYSEMWNEVCFLLFENNRDKLAEKDFENQVVRAVEVLGWREFRNEIERQPKVQLGREGTLRPDLIVYGNDRRVLIVIEIKRPSENLTRDNIIGQLRSYMRQMRSDFGFLIGSDLRVYYDGRDNPDSDPLLLERIIFERNAADGINFIHLFNKNSFLNKEYDEYLKAKISKFNRKREVDSIVTKIISLEIKDKIKNFLRNEFPDVSDDTFSDAFDKVNIEISKKEIAGLLPVKPKERKTGSRMRKPLESIEIRKIESSKIASISFENYRNEVGLRQIYAVLYYMKQGVDFTSAIHEALRLFPNVKHYNTIEDKCARRFAGNVGTFIAWFESGQILGKLQDKFHFSDHDYNIFKNLLSNRQ
ncbi:MAG: hypothetical protein C4567_01030 [Deltaproteobacteria bacterium]|nr:MAG: hypothetical protein C4567_01030 [Deltaproteobacteria bacterium]